jgi:hypothetical protein
MELKKTTKSSCQLVSEPTSAKKKKLSTRRFLYYPEYGERTLLLIVGKWQGTLSQNTIEVIQLT